MIFTSAVYRLHIASNMPLIGGERRKLQSQRNRPPPFGGGRSLRDLRAALRRGTATEEVELLLKLRLGSVALDLVVVLHARDERDASLGDLAPLDQMLAGQLAPQGARDQHLLRFFAEGVDRRVPSALENPVREVHDRLLLFLGEEAVDVLREQRDDCSPHVLVGRVDERGNLAQRDVVGAHAVQPIA